MLAACVVLAVLAGVAHCYDENIAFDADIGQKVLVVLDTLDMKRSHSMFFHDLAGVGCRARLFFRFRLSFCLRHKRFVFLKVKAST